MPLENTDQLQERNTSQPGVGLNTYIALLNLPPPPVIHSEVSALSPHLHECKMGISA